MLALRHRTPFGGALAACLVAAACSSTPPVRDAGVDAGPTCAARADCPSGELCAAVDGGPKSCGGCLKNADCLPQELCTTSFRCAFRPGWGDQCARNADCAAGQFCDQGLCAVAGTVTLCSRNNCPVGDRCNIGNQVCEQDLGCTSDSDCAASQVCNPGTLVCQSRCDPADAGAVCDPTQQCVGSRCVDCTQSSDCGAGLTCDVASGRCSAPGLCYSDATCAAGQVCNLATHACGTKPAPCTSNDGCPAGQVCDVPSGKCLSATCQADQFSPNQTAATAAPIAVGASYQGLTLCGPSDQDFYALPLASGDTLQVTVATEVTGAGYSFVVKLLDDAGVILGTGQNLALDAVVPLSATYFLQMTDADSNCVYGFSTLVSHGQPCPPDPLGDQGDRAHAVFLDGGVGPIYLCAGQADWFEVQVPGGGLTVTLGSDPTQGPLALAASTVDGGPIAAVASGAAEQSLTVKGATPVFLTVTGSGQNNAYTLTLTAADGGFTPTRDAGVTNVPDAGDGG